jgi:hypothetical protein
VLAASSVTGWSSRVTRIVVATVFTGCVLGEALAASHVHLEGAGGYEDVARFVVQHSNTPAGVLFSGAGDAGYFSFFVRLHDDRRRVIVLRSDKLFTISRMEEIAYRDRIGRPEEIDAVVRDLGIRFVVIEDKSSSSRVLNWVRDRVKRPPFVERLRVPIRSRDPMVHGADLVIFENAEATSPDRDAVLSFDLPVVNRSFEVRFGDAIAGPGRRSDR